MYFHNSNKIPAEALKIKVGDDQLSATTKIHTYKKTEV